MPPLVGPAFGLFMEAKLVVPYRAPLLSIPNPARRRLRERDDLETEKSNCHK
jgi:hypothetical protein